MIRPRGGDFVYTHDEFHVMKNDIAEAGRCGVDGVVLGLLLQDGRVDTERTAELVGLARPLEVTFHRAIDWAPDMEQALDQVISAGADRVLTSGGKATALLATDNLSRLVGLAGERIKVMVCGGIRQENVADVARRTGASEFHAALRRKVDSPATYRNAGLFMGQTGADEFARYSVMAEDVFALREAMRAASSE